MYSYVLMYSLYVHFMYIIYDIYANILRKYMLLHVTERKRRLFILYVVQYFRTNISYVKGTLVRNGMYGVWYSRKTYVQCTV